ncbi:hypothetical protein J699_02963 [Acinetobacter sp. 1000160]|nr:hypothetical protein J522_3090 [Acinetobacter baumannii 146457]EYT17078.1 hypothetical protein J699_02963 [Acinetobacter sp. 1000160]
MNNGVLQQYHQKLRFSFKHIQERIENQYFSLGLLYNSDKRNLFKNHNVI